MDVVTQFIESLSKVGFPVIITALLLYAIIKFIPQFFEERKVEKANEQKAFNDRQESYKAQNEATNTAMHTIIQVAEQGNQMVAMATRVIEQNTEALKNNSDVHKEVKASVSTNTEALKELVGDMEQHDHRAEKIGRDVAIIKDRTE